jgi:DNA-binding transcriptional MerR regulator/catechol 2,3-dioxygenase-like lactoylglutathione lyase family enzyme
MTTEGRSLQIGELARSTGLTVRALRHYDTIGLVKASERTSAGYRLYTAADITRLYEVLALRGLGFSLQQVGALLEGDGADPHVAVRRQLKEVDRRIGDLRQLQVKLQRVLEFLGSGTEPSTDELLDIIGRTVTAMPSFSQVVPRLPVVDLGRTLDFYQDHFAFEVDVLWPRDHPTFAILRREGSGLGFFEPDEHRGPGGYAELYIEVGDAAGLHESVKDQVPIEWGPEVYSYGRWEFALRDPDGYLVIFTERTEHPPTTHEPSP